MSPTLDFQRRSEPTVAAAASTNGHAAPRQTATSRRKAAMPPSLGKKLPLANLFVAAGLVAALYLALVVVLPSGAWLRDFLIARGFAQPATLLLFTTAVLAVVARARSSRRDAAALATAENEEPESAFASKVSSTPETVVFRRLSRMRQFARSHGSDDLRSYSRALSESDQATLDHVHAFPSEAAQILPLIGFAGSLIGLSRALYLGFVAGGGTSSVGFGAAIATAWDSSLLAIGCTIVLLCVQRPTRRREEQTLAGLDRLMARRLLMVPRSDDPSRVQGALDSILQRVRHQLEDIGRSMASLTGELLTQGAENAAMKLEDSVRLTANEIFAKLARVQEEDRASLQEAVGSRVAQAMESTVAVIAAPLHDQVDALTETRTVLEQQGDTAARAIAEAVRDNLTRVSAELARAMDKPRPIQLIEAPHPENAR